MIGIKNLGNTCYISSAVHLLANCIELSKYFLSKTHLEELNKTNKKNARGFVTKMYYDLMKDYWLSAKESLQPVELKNMVQNLTSQVNYFKINEIKLKALRFKQKFSNKKFFIQKFKIF